MIVSEGVMQENPPIPNSTAATPLILETLPNVLAEDSECPRRTRSQLDLLLLAIEALDLTGSEAILAVSQELDLQSVIRHRVALWRLRSTNPMRRLSQRQPMNLSEAKALTVIICNLARRLTVILRQLVLAQRQMAQGEDSAIQVLQLQDYLDRYRALFRARMNQRRTMSLYDSDEALNTLALEQLTRLLFCTGTSGLQRLWISLFDGEVA
ncbi:DUF3038 domain-containing protein [filamentous cyanobacterium LEGE 11480]|uniref:DUF3038 domain-containing protein n=1 Tax=Romeriopsis navalis LEGE 11480 TaxID=2777977 RepID=A0A928Z3L8_9CYAN|nr:DUF3038 domain-containing protein [Romeriopsis navalis]MBE9030814.1 DUF3038 domain-containing protein [Romeriopsis navalis LEGE 11480]